MPVWAGAKAEADPIRAAMVAIFIMVKKKGVGGKDKKCRLRCGGWWRITPWRSGLGGHGYASLGALPVKITQLLIFGYKGK